MNELSSVQRPNGLTTSVHTPTTKQVNLSAEDQLEISKKQQRRYFRI